MKVEKIILIIVVAVLVGVLGFLGFNYIRTLTDKKENPVVSMEIEGYGTVEIELYPDMAPNTVKNFIKLAENGFYDGKTFSEIGDSFVKGGFDLTETSKESEETAVVNDSEGAEEETIVGPKLSDIKDLDDGEEDEAYSIKGEFVDNDFDKNTLSHKRGVISMARKDTKEYSSEIAMMQLLGDDYKSTLDMILDNMNDSAASGFFILTKDNTSYNGTYAAFGEVISGMDVIDKISAIETKEDESGKMVPVSQPVIKSVKVDTKGVDYGTPETETAFDFDSIFNMFLSNFTSQN